MNIPAFGGTAFSGMPAPGSRYILPSFEERTAYGYKRQDPYAKLFEDRIIFLGVQVDDASADDIIAQLLVLESLKMEIPVEAPVAGRVSRILVEEGQAVDEGDILMVLD